MFRPTLIATVTLSFLAGCEAPSDSQADAVSASAMALEEGFPDPVSLGDFSGTFFPSEIGVTLVEKDEEGDGYRALVIDLVEKRVVHQVVGPRDEYPKVMELIAHHGIERATECGIGQGVFVPPPVPTPQCGGLRCQPGDYVERAMRIAELSCPQLMR